MLKITVYIGHMDGSARPVEIARMVERSGLYGVAIGEHIALGSDLGNYPYEGGLAHGEGGRKPYLEPGAGRIARRVVVYDCERFDEVGPKPNGHAAGAALEHALWGARADHAYKVLRF